jgi:hypothetical protein
LKIQWNADLPAGQASFTMIVMINYIDYNKTVLQQILRGYKGLDKTMAAANETNEGRINKMSCNEYQNTNQDIDICSCFRFNNMITNSPISWFNNIAPQNMPTTWFDSLNQGAFQVAGPSKILFSVVTNRNITAVVASSK